MWTSFIHAFFKHFLENSPIVLSTYNLWRVRCCTVLETMAFVQKFTGVIPVSLDPKRN